MSQTKILQILKDLGGQESTSKIREEAKKRFSGRTLHSHAGIRLNSLKDKDLVTKEEADTKTIWELTEQGMSLTAQNFSINQSCSDTCRAKLTDFGINISNIVSTTDFDKQIDLYQISNQIDNIFYNAESDSHANFRLDAHEDVLIRVPSSGRITLVGAKNKNEIIQSTDIFCEKINDLGINIQYNLEKVKVQNIVAGADLGRELSLEELASDIDSDNIEYDPKHAPNIIYRPTCPGTILIYRSGKVILNGVKTYDQMLTLYEVLLETLPINVVY